MSSGLATCYTGGDAGYDPSPNLGLWVVFIRVGLARGRGHK